MKKRETKLEKFKRRYLPKYIAKYNTKKILEHVDGWSKEVIYQNIFNTFCQRHKIENIYYPLGAGANYSLMYMIARIVEENEIKSVLELGCGQSTIFFNNLKKVRKFNIISFESDEFWGTSIGSKVPNQIHITPLIERQREKIKYKTYDFSKLGKEKFDFVMIDGPNGTKQYSRFGITEIIENNKLAKEFILLFDDTDRGGEVETIEFCKKLFDAKGIKYYESTKTSNKHQTVLVTEKFRKVLYY